jgi:hypothetical protein
VTETLADLSQEKLALHQVVSDGHLIVDHRLKNVSHLQQQPLTLRIRDVRVGNPVKIFVKLRQQPRLRHERDRRPRRQIPRPIRRIRDAPIDARYILADLERNRQHRV